MRDPSGRCFCGSLRWSVKGAAIWAAHCHCNDCRRAASADYVSWLGVAREDLTWSGPLTRFTSSPGVTRGFCAHCGAPAFFETDIFPGETHLYAASLDDLTQYRPTAHIFWSERVPWLKGSDALAKHDKGLQHAEKAGRNLVR